MNEYADHDPLSVATNDVNVTDHDPLNVATNDVNVADHDPLNVATNDVNSADHNPLNVATDSVNDVNTAANRVAYFCKIYYESISPLQWSVKLSIVRRLNALEEVLLTTGNLITKYLLFLVYEKKTT